MLCLFNCDKIYIKLTILTKFKCIVLNTEHISHCSIVVNTIIHPEPLLLPQMKLCTQLHEFPISTSAPDNHHPIFCLYKLVYSMYLM